MEQSGAQNFRGQCAFLVLATRQRSPKVLVLKIGDGGFLWYIAPSQAVNVGGDARIVPGGQEVHHRAQSRGHVRAFA